MQTSAQILKEIRNEINKIDKAKQLSSFKEDPSRQRTISKAVNQEPDFSSSFDMAPVQHTKGNSKTRGLGEQQQKENMKPTEVQLNSKFSSQQSSSLDYSYGAGLLGQNNISLTSNATKKDQLGYDSTYQLIRHAQAQTRDTNNQQEEEDKFEGQTLKYQSIAAAVRKQQYFSYQDQSRGNNNINIENNDESLVASSDIRQQQEIGSPNFSQNPIQQHQIKNLNGGTNIFEEGSHSLHTMTLSQQQIHDTISQKSSNTVGSSIKSEQMFNNIQSGLFNLRQEFERECDDITDKIDEIMRTELITFDKLKDISSISLEEDM